MQRIEHTQSPPDKSLQPGAGCAFIEKPRLLYFVVAAWPGSSRQAILSMNTIAEGFIRLASHLEVVRFDDPDEAQGAEEVVLWCLSQASDDERDLLREAACRQVAQLRAEGAPRAALIFMRGSLEELRTRRDNLRRPMRGGVLTRVIYCSRN